MPTDPNWLPSTLAQATAALVAIIGGFLVSRLIGMASARSGLDERAATLRGQIKALRPEHARVRRESEASIRMTIRGHTREPVDPSEVRRRDAAVDRRGELEVQMRVLQTDLRIVEDERASVAKAEGVWPGLGVLTVFAALGVIYPMVTMSRRPVPDGPGTRWSMVAAFIVGFALFMAYIAYYVRRVSKPTAGSDESSAQG